MSVFKKELKLFLLILGLAFYLGFFLSKFGYAEPAGADVTNLSTSTYSSTPDARQDLGGTITTLGLDTTQQDVGWKAYVGNVSGKLVLRNSGGWSIYEWALNSTGLSGYVFVSRNGSVAWYDVVCANSSVISTEENFLGINNNASDSINRTFNSTGHSAMDMSGPSNIFANTCPSTATYVNGTAQVVNENAYFQEILLYDRTSLNFVYGTFINQNAWGYGNNASLPITYDFQLIIAENRSASVGTPYYFYADIS